MDILHHAFALTKASELMSPRNMFINPNRKEKKMMKISNPSSLINLTLALLLAFSLMTGCATTQGGKAAEVELTDSTVRVPPGDPTKFWDSFAWKELTKAEQALWGVLGWTEESWEGEAKQPASEDKYWNQLSEEEKEACRKLGYNKRLWDES
jgi:hypothetical protein